MFATRGRRWCVEIAAYTFGARRGACAAPACTAPACTPPEDREAGSWVVLDDVRPDRGSDRAAPRSGSTAMTRTRQAASANVINAVERRREPPGITGSPPMFASARAWPEAPG